MSDRVPVPDRVRAGSPSPIATSAQYLEHVARATHDPSGYWLEEAARRLRWRTLPTIGLEGDFHTIAEAPVRWFSDGVGSSRVDLQACKLEYSIVSPK